MSARRTVAKCGGSTGVGLPGLSMSTFLVEADPGRFHDRVAPLLYQDPVLHTLPMSVLDAVCRGRYPEWILARVEAEDATVAAVGVRTPPYNVIVAATERQAVRRLAEGLVELGQELPGVIGLVPWVQGFADDWSALTGLLVEEDRAERLFRLDTLLPPRPADGRDRLADDAQVELLTEWMRRFLAETDLREPLDVRASIELAVGDGRMYVWEVNGDVVSFCGHGLAVGGQARIGPVYTPPDRRGRGYASNLVAHVTATNLERGLIPTLFTDLANPTSNGIYQAIGYQAVADALMLSFRSAEER
jgi:predicted GNAT family acetyltransferase